MSSFHIREAQPQDLEGLFTIFSLADALHREAHPEIFREAAPDEIKGYLLDGILAEDGMVFVAEASGEIVGAIIAWTREVSDNPLLVKRTYLNIENLIVLEDYRHQGLGWELIRQIELWAQGCGLKHLQLTVWDFNHGAVAFYEKLGYEMLHHHMRKELT